MMPRHPVSPVANSFQSSLNETIVDRQTDRVIENPLPTLGNEETACELEEFARSRRERCRTRRTQQMLAWTVVAIGATGWTSALSCVILSLAGFVMTLVKSSMADDWYVLPALWLTLMLVALIFFMPSELRALGVRFYNSSPGMLHRRLGMKSLADHLRLLRIVVVGATMLPFLVCLADSWVARSHRDVPPISDEWPALAGWGFFLLAGWMLVRRVVSTYRSAHARSLHRSLRTHHRGVSLRSFIPEWDNPTRDIYRSCRLSARVGHVHRVVSVATIGCFTASACWAATISAHSFLGECLGILSLLSLATQWPTANNVVTWTGQMIDPFCADPDEYQEY